MKWFEDMKETIQRSETLGSDVQISSDGHTCWVNDERGVCIGRWSPVSIDVHDTFEGQMSGKQCLDCVPEGSWPLFVELMSKHYGVSVPSDMIDEEKARAVWPGNREGLRQ